MILEKFKEFDTFYDTVEKEINPTLSASEKILTIYNEQMLYIINVVGKDVLTTVYTAAMTNQVEEDHYLISPERKIFQILNNYIAEGVTSGEFRQDLSIADMQSIIQRCMRANVYDWLIHNETFDLVKEMQLFTSVVLSGLKAKKGASN